MACRSRKNTTPPPASRRKLSLLNQPAANGPFLQFAAGSRSSRHDSNTLTSTRFAATQLPLTEKHTRSAPKPAIRQRKMAVWYRNPAPGTGFCSPKTGQDLRIGVQNTGIAVQRAVFSVRGCGFSRHAVCFEHRRLQLGRRIRRYR